MPLPTEYSALTHALLERAAASRTPASGVFELTSRCNLACRMCYIRNEACATEELPAAAWLELARQAVDHGMIFLLLTGGEVFLRQDFWEIYEPIARMGVILTLFTNATLIRRDHAARLRAAPPHRTEVTLYGATAPTYEAVTGVPGSFARAVAGIENLLAAGIPLVVKTTLTRLNADELDAMRRMADEWRVPFHAGWLLTPRRDGRIVPLEELRLPPEQGVALERAWNVEEHRNPKQPNDNQHRGAFYCSAGRNSFVVTSTGRMNVCIDLPQPAVKPLELGFSEAWNRLVHYVDSVPASPVCSRCPLEDACPRCPAWAYLEMGDFQAPVPSLCRLMEARHGVPALRKPCA